MLNVTEDAKQMLKESLVTNTDAPDFGLRLVHDKSGHLTLVLGQEKEDDQVIEHEGLKVLLVDKELFSDLDGKTLDCQKSPEGRHFVMSEE